MSFLGLFGEKTSERDPEAIARWVVESYSQRRTQGDCRVNDWLHLVLQRLLPKQVAQTIVEKFLSRLAFSDPQAGLKLQTEIVIAISDAEHYAKTFKPMMAAREPDKTVPQNSRPSASNTNAKALAGQPISSADEDAVLFEGILGQK